jgi:hypothetical protein
MVTGADVVLEFVTGGVVLVDVVTDVVLVAALDEVFGPGGFSSPRPKR